jgi:hypothetical protein
MRDALVHALRVFVGDARLAGSRVRLAVRLALRIAAVVVAFVLAAKATAKVRSAGPMPLVPPDGPDGERFGLSEAKRRAIFADFAAAEPRSIQNGLSSFPTERWSAEDHRGAFERERAGLLAASHRLNLSQVYLVLDEGIRNHWPGPDGKPLNPHTIPLKPRRKY